MTSYPKFILALLFVTIVSGAGAQTLFTYGKYKVDKSEFLKAFSKNNAEVNPTERAYRDYLNLYIRFKLKVREALDRKMDTLPNQKAELESFRNQIAENFMNDEASVEALIDEAAKRSQKDIHLAHLYVAVAPNSDSQTWKQAEARINKAYKALQEGQDFGRVVSEYSDDKASASHGGDIGWITCLVLPYDLETAAYTTPVGQVSAPVRSSIGFHIFKNLGERKAVGKMKAAQILLTLPPGASQDQLQVVHRRADSLYRALENGADFKELALQFSNDNLSFQTGGEIAEFGVGRYDPAFENAAFALEKDGDISRPVQTDFGIHIIKRLSRQTIPDADEPSYRTQLSFDIKQSDRMEVAREALVKKLKDQTHFHELPFDRNYVKVFTDSVLQNKKLPPTAAFPLEKGLFVFGDQTYTLGDWKNYLEGIRSFSVMHSGKSWQQLYNEFITKSGMDYYRSHLEAYNPAFRAQIDEFREGNLLFEIMQRKVWDVAASDSVGLQKYYSSHKDRYWWDASADAIIFTCSSDSVANHCKEVMRNDIEAWRNLINLGNGTVQGDSGRFELSQIPVVERTRFTEGLFTANVTNPTDHSSSFAYIVKLYPNREPRAFSDARGFVINDYQGYLEDRWVESLKKKYPVKVNEVVFRSMIH